MEGKGTRAKKISHFGMKGNCALTKGRGKGRNEGEQRERRRVCFETGTQAQEPRGKK